VQISGNHNNEPAYADLPGNSLLPGQPAEILVFKITICTGLNDLHSL